MVTAGGFYFGYFGVLGIFMPYWSAYLTAHGFAPARIGELVAIMFVVRLVVPHFWGYLGDRSGKRVIWMRFSVIGGALCFAGIYGATHFWHFALVIFGYSLFWNGALPLFEARVLHEYGPRYAQVRLWGSLGFIVATILGGQQLAQRIEDLPTLMLLCMGVAIGASLNLKDTPLPRSPQIPQAIGTILIRKEVLTVYLAALLMVASHGAYYGFFALYLHHYGYDLSWSGGLWTLGVGAEVLAFLGGPWLLRHFEPKSLLTIAFLVTAMRWLLTAEWGGMDARWLIFAQLLHAFSYAVHHTATMAILQRHFGEGTQSRGQALYSSVSYGFGGALGGLLCGYLWEWGGPIAAFGACAGMAGGGWLLSRWGIDNVSPSDFPAEIDKP